MKIAGYKKFSMSNNAVAAYENGEKPFSKWTKQDIIEEIEKLLKKNELSLNCSIEKLRKAPVKVLRNLCLSYSSWHHTSNHYNKTDFYSLDTSEIEKITNKTLDEEIFENKSKIAENQVEEKWKCAFLEWGGTRKHPVAKEITEVGIVKGDWFIRADGSKKKITANGFRFLEKYQ